MARILQYFEEVFIMEIDIYNISRLLELFCSGKLVKIVEGKDIIPYVSYSFCKGLFWLKNLP